MVVFSIGPNGINLLHIMALPLVDGAYLTIILTNQLKTILSSIIIGTTILSGIASFSIAQKLKGNLQTKLYKLTIINSVFLILLLIVTVLSVIISTLINTNILRIFASISILLIAIKISNVKISKNKVSRTLNPTLIILIGLLLSIRPNHFKIKLILNMDLIFHSLIAGMSAITLTSITSLINLPKKINTHKTVNHIPTVILIIISLKVLGIL